MLLLCACACQQAFGLKDPTLGDGGLIDDDAPTARSDARVCWDVAAVQLSFCLTTPPTDTFVISAPTTIDTGTDARCASTTNPNVCVLAHDSITISVTGSLRGVGSRPLVLVARSITIQGSIDVASHRGVPNGVGAGAGVGPCNAGTAAQARGGGPGGSFGTKGGDGGNQDGGTGPGGKAGAVIVDSGFRGGCAGTVGGGALSPGAGGGAVALLGDTITLSGPATVNASGAGGNAGDNDDGGSGGGSGGLFVLSTTSLTATPGSVLFANGGGGGGAGDNTSSGQHGTDPARATEGGLGGQGAGSDAGDGGDGFPAAVSLRNGINGGAALAGGGGGAGGAGIIRLIGTTVPAGVTFSPPPS